jgi:hypothetical protein
VVWLVPVVGIEKTDCIKSIGSGASGSYSTRSISIVSMIRNLDVDDAFPTVNVGSREPIGDHGMSGVPLLSKDALVAPS